MGLSLDGLLESVIDIAKAADKAILAIYRRSFEVTYKDDASPLTEADLVSHQVIMDGLSKLEPAIPILSEEGTKIPWAERQQWRTFWLVDPIDGTKDFVNRSGEFTVNIALVHEGVPVLGVVTAPALGEVFAGIVGKGAWKIDATGRRAISVVEPRSPLRVVASKNHLNAETRVYIDQLGEHVLVQAGSSLKFCRIAEGAADHYPRLGPTCEWDIGAAQAVLEAAGGQVTTLEGAPMVYGKESVLNPYFVARGR